MKQLLIVFRVYHKVSMCTWNSRAFNGCWHGQGLRTGCLCMSRGCREGYGVLFGVGTVNPQLREHSRMLHQGLIKAIKGSEWKKCQGPSEMIGGIVSGDSLISVGFT